MFSVARDRVGSKEARPLNAGLLYSFALKGLKQAMWRISSNMCMLSSELLQVTSQVYNKHQTD